MVTRVDFYKMCFPNNFYRRNSARIHWSNCSETENIINVNLTTETCVFSVYFLHTYAFSSYASGLYAARKSKLHVNMKIVITFLSGNIIMRPCVVETKENVIFHPECDI
jgi:hypothetical protein